MTRVEPPRRTLESLARAGALKAIAGNRRRAYWEIEVWEQRHQRPEPPTQLHLFDDRTLDEAEVPELPELSTLELVRWDWRTQGAPRLHPLALARRHLNELGVTTADAPVADTRASVAGLVIMRQRPPTTRGFMFITVEDETGFVQCIASPKLQQRLHDILFQPNLIVRGMVQRQRHWCCVVLEQAWGLERLSQIWSSLTGPGGGSLPRGCCRPRRGGHCGQGVA